MAITKTGHVTGNNLFLSFFIQRRFEFLRNKCQFYKYQEGPKKSSFQKLKSKQITKLEIR